MNRVHIGSVHAPRQVMVTRSFTVFTMSTSKTGPCLEVEWRRALKDEALKGYIQDILVS